jgi:putative transcriptional regulator
MWNVPENERVEVTSENFGDLLIASAKEALAIARGEMAPVRIGYASTTTRNVRVATPPPFDAERVRALRRRLDLSQSVFAQVLGVSDKTVKAWEQGHAPTSPMRRLLEIAEEQPALFLAKVSKDTNTSRTPPRRSSVRDTTNTAHSKR